MNKRLTASAAFVLCSVLTTSCRSPMADAQMVEQMRGLADELNGLRQDMGMLNEQMDSLRTVVVRQDTLLRQLAGMAGVPVPQRY